VPKCPSAKCPFSTCHQPYSANIRPPGPPSCVLPHPPVPRARHRQRAIPFFDAFPLLIFAFASSQEKIFARISATASCDRPRRHSPIRYSVIIKSTAQHSTARHAEDSPFRTTSFSSGTTLTPSTHSNSSFWHCCSKPAKAVQDELEPALEPSIIPL
jgi:hypothetical protein